MTLGSISSSQKNSDSLSGKGAVAVPTPNERARLLSITSEHDKHRKASIINIRRASLANFGNVSQKRSALEPAWSESGKRSNYLSEEGGFDIITGPIMEQLLALYAWHSGILIMATAVGVIYRLWGAVIIFVTLSWMGFQISRIMMAANPLSLGPLYISLIPYSMFILLGSQLRISMVGFWVTTISAIFLQYGTSYHQRRVITVFILMVVIYLVFLPIMPVLLFPVPIQFGDVTYSSRYNNPCLPNVTPCSCPSDFKLNPEGNACDWMWVETIDYRLEWTFVVTLCVICYSLYMLKEHIREYAFNLLEKQTVLAKLHDQNANLKAQLSQFRNDVDLDLDSPITKVIKFIRDIQKKSEIDAEIMETLDYVIHLLSSNQLFLPNLNLNAEAMDVDINKWLNAMITNSNINALPAQDAFVSDISGSFSRSNPSSNLPPGLEDSNILPTIDKWEFNIFEFRRLTFNQPLFYLGQILFDMYKFDSVLGVDRLKYLNFLAKVEAGYRPVPYHNSMHAADVMHAMHYFFTTLGLGKLLFPEELFAGLIAASIHDVDHPGFNNAFMIASGSQLAMRYNDTAVLEYHHCATGFEIMNSDPTCNVLSSFSAEKYKTIRGNIVSMVLATDMSSHFEYIAKFKNKMNGSGLDYKDAKDRQLALDIAIKCGDINNAAKNNEISTQWTALIMDEFFRQGDEEKARGLPVSMFMDRQTTVISKCQVGFIDYIVLPLFEVWDTYMNEDGQFPAMQYLRGNREYWKKQTDELQNVKVQ